MNFKGAAKRIDDIDLPKLGALIGVGEDELHAFMEVEASGSGFDRAGRPKMLFEPHIFYRHLLGNELDRAVERGLAYRKWGEKKYPKDSYDRLIKAMQINPEMALRSASWGLSQILGMHHLTVDYPSAEAMVRSFMDDEENQLRATIELLISMGIDDDLRAHRWQVVARVWNGPGYARNGYDVKLEAAFQKWKKIRDTAFVAPVKPKK
jgi:hypothetical protein